MSWADEAKGQSNKHNANCTLREVPTPNGGGFSSIRTAPILADLSNSDGIRLRVKGDGRRYTWSLASNGLFRGRQVRYWAEFETTDGAWTTVDIPFANFRPQFRGFQLSGPELDLSEIMGMGLMIYDKQDGPFELRLASVHTYAEPPSN